MKKIVPASPVRRKPTHDEEDDELLRLINLQTDRRSMPIGSGGAWVQPRRPDNDND